MARADRSKPQIDEVIGIAGQLAEKNKNRLIVDAQENLGALTADSLRPEQIPLNLLSNACKCTKRARLPCGCHFLFLLCLRRYPARRIA